MREENIFKFPQLNPVALNYTLDENLHRKRGNNLKCITIFIEVRNRDLMVVIVVMGSCCEIHNNIIAVIFKEQHAGADWLNTGRQMNMVMSEF